MFRKIVLFEIQNRIRRPALYLYFAAALLFTIVSFATGALPVGEKEHINAPYLIALWCAAITMMMMLVSSSVMGTALYRDIEYNTKDYYLTYPITKAGYFWGRYVGSFLCMIFIASSILVGIYIGSRLGPAMGWRDPKEYGPHHLSYYLHPFFVIALPNLLFTSSLFFGLVAITRNVKVIYSGGILLFLGYSLSIFFLHTTNNATVINLADPFGLNGIRLQTDSASAVEKNSSLFPVEGNFLLNRLIWPGLGIVVLLYTYIRFDFEKFFSGKRDKAAMDDARAGVKRPLAREVKISFKGAYNRRTLLTLTRLELTNIFRDNYFWIILSSSMIFLGFILSLGSRNHGVPDFPRTVLLLDIFNNAFPFFIFFIIMFYTGESLHRDRSTRYAFINDSLPPPNWVMNGSRLSALLILGVTLGLLPLLLAMGVQLAKGYTQFHLQLYAGYFFIMLLPRLLEMVLFCYAAHVVINNKFVAHGIGITIWVVLFLLESTGIFDYNLLMYSYTPTIRPTDMDGLGHMVAAAGWFDLYWLIVGGLLILISALFYYRGVSSSFRERLQLLAERFDRRTRLFTGALLLLFMAVGGYIYYNVSYLNTYLLPSEKTVRAIAYEKAFKKYQDLPFPKVTRIKMNADLYPDKQQAFIKAFITVVNRDSMPVKMLLLDADDLTDYSLRQEGLPLPFSSPLIYPRPKFSWFRLKQDTAPFRLYQFPRPLAPGDSTILELHSEIVPKGFSNGAYGQRMLRNGIFFAGGLPGLGYDDDDEEKSPYARKKAGLLPRFAKEVAQDDPEGIRTLKAGNASDLLDLDLTVSTAADQTVLAPGDLQRQWQQGGRNYFHFVQTAGGFYPPLAILSARYKIARDTVQLDHPVEIGVYYCPEQNANIQRFMNAYRDGLRYFSSSFGTYPFKAIRLAETSGYGPREASISTLDTYSEENSWNAAFDNPNQFDYCYFNTARLLAQQWWRYQVAPNATVGSLVIPEGLAIYSALALAEKKYGETNIKQFVQDQLWFYLFIRRRFGGGEHPLIKADQWYEWGGKAGVVLYGLKDLIGEDSLNAALRDFKNAWSFKSRGPFAGANDLYHCLQRHTPDSLQYYLTDTWEKITLYDNKLKEARSASTGRGDEYKVTLTIEVGKTWIDSKGNDVPATAMNDYIDIGIFAANSNNKEGRSESNPLFLKKYKLTAGLHTITVMVKGKPVVAGIDPLAKLIDRNPRDNMKDLK